MLGPAFASHERRQRTRVCHADAPAPLGSRERASRGCPHRRCGPVSPNFCNRQGLRHPLYPTRPLRLTSAAIAPGPICRRCLIPLRRPDRSRTAIFCPHIAVPQAPAAKRVNLNPWRLTRSCTASGHAPAAQNCPRSRTRLTPWLRRFSGAANAVGASEAGVLKTQTGERKSFAQS